MKKCNICNENKELHQFYKDKRKKDGLYTKCKTCHCRDTKRSAEKHKQARLAKQAEYREVNRELLREKDKEYSRLNREKINEQKREYNAANKEKISEYNRKRNALPEVKAAKQKNREENRERYNQYSRDWYDKNKKQHNAACRDWEERNPEKAKARVERRRAKLKEIGDNSSRVFRRRILNLFNNKCFNCKTKENLSVDHHYPISHEIPLYLNNAVVLCSSCNSKKGRKDPSDYYSKEQLEALEIYLK